MENLKVYKVLCNPDLTEGRGYFKHEYYITESKEDLIKFLDDKYGKGNDYVMGVLNCPMKKYSIYNEHVYQINEREGTFNIIEDFSEVEKIIKDDIKCKDKVIMYVYMEDNRYKSKVISLQYIVEQLKELI